jgi:ligand-binding SRPBCC domain-containing protein
MATYIAAPQELCFDLARDVELHIKSTAGTYERAVKGVTTGLIGPGEEVTWQATHFGIRQKLTSRITAFDRPHYFRDSQAAGPFHHFDHDHFFSIESQGVLMRDVFEYQSPFGWLGRLADRIFLISYMTEFLRRRAQVIKETAEERSMTGRRV